MSEADEIWKYIGNHLIPQLDRSTISIHAVNDEIELDRTGVLYSIADQHFVLTAAHELRTLVTSNVPLCVRVPGPKPTPVPLIEARFYGTETDERDIAAIWLPNHVARGVTTHYEFLRHNSVQCNGTAPQTYYLIFGYPTHWQGWKPIIYLATQYSGNPPAKSFDDRIHELFAFDRHAWNIETNECTDLPHPEGLSGAGIWRIDPFGCRRRHGDKPSLVAIAQEYNGSRGFIKGTKIAFCLDRIICDFPTLRRPMELIYPS